MSLDVYLIEIRPCRAAGELVATFEALADAEAACRAINNREGEG